MGNSVQTERVLRFLDFQVNLNTGEVWKAGVRLKLQDQPFKVLAILLQRPGQVVTREELRQLIWPEESFGDFDHAINLAVNKLRSILRDSANVLQLMKTLPRRGYRFIAPVENPVADAGEPGRRSSVLILTSSKAHFSGLPAIPRWVRVGIALLVLLSAAAVWRSVQKRPESRLPPVEV